MKNSNLFLRFIRSEYSDPDSKRRLFYSDFALHNLAYQAFLLIPSLIIAMLRLPVVKWTASGSIVEGVGNTGTTISGGGLWRRNWRHLSDEGQKRSQ